MKYLRLIWANLKRKKIRTTLTIGSFIVALFLYGLLIAIQVAFAGDPGTAGVDRLSTINKISLIMPLPFSYRDRLTAIPGVKAVTFATWFGGVYKDKKNFFPQFAVDSESWFDVYGEYKVTKQAKAAFLADRQACMVGRNLANRYGFKPGDRLPLQGTIWSGVWEFNVAGIYDPAQPEVDTTGMLFRYDYLEERRPFGKGTVGWYVIKLDNKDDSVKITKTIDAMFANSPYETLTQTEKAFAASFAKQMGNIQLLVMAIGSVVFFTLLLVAGNTMAIAVRERTGEIAVLKTIGYSDRAVLGLILAESVLVAGQGGVLGLLLAVVMVPGVARALPMFGNLALPVPALLGGLGLTLLIGVAAGIIPAVMAMRLKVVDALRRV
jgi:putative ABC transport system permease protein